MVTTSRKFQSRPGRASCAGHACMALLALLALPMRAADLRNDGFESYPIGQTFLAVTNGWQADAPGARVQADTVAEGLHALVVPEASGITNTVSAAGLTRVWTDQLLLPSLGDMPSGASDPSETLRLYFGTNGLVSLATDGGWVTIAADYFGYAVPPVSNAWVRLTVCHDYTARTVAVLLDGRLLREKFPFVGSATAAAYQSVAYVNANDTGSPTNGYVDAVLISTNLPPTPSLDLDNDGMPDAMEIDRFGTVTNYHRPVITLARSTLGGPGGQGGSVSPSNTFDVLPGATNTFTIAALPAYVVTDVRTNGVSVGSFPGRNTRAASYTYAGITSDTALTLEFTYTGLRRVPDDYASLAGAVAAAVSNETITVGAGSYAQSGPIVIDRPLTLTGDTNAPDNVELTAAAAGDDRDLFQVQSPNVTIQGFRLAGVQNGTAPADGWINAAIMIGNNAADAQMDANRAILGLTNVLIRCNVFTNCAHGIYALQATNTPAALCAFVGNGTGVFVNGAAALDARSNWWGAISGPSGAGPGTGDAVSTNVLFEPWASDAARSHRVFDVRAGESIQGAVDAADPGDYVQIQGGAYTGSIAFAKTLSLLGTGVVIRGHVNLQASVTNTWALPITASNLNVTADTHPLLITPDLTLTALVINAGATLAVSNGTLRANGLTLTGTFTLDSGWAPLVTTAVSTLGGPGGAGGTVSPSGTFYVVSGTVTSFVAAAFPAYVVSDVRTNGVSVGTFPGQGTRSATYPSPAIRNDTTVTVEFTYTGLRNVPDDYATPAAAVAAAVSNETIVVAAGTYPLSAPLVIDRPLTLTGDTAAPENVVITAAATGEDRDIVQVRSGNVVIQGFTLSGAQNGTAPADGWINAAVMVGNTAADAQMDANRAIPGLTNVALRCNVYTNCAHGVYGVQATNVVATLSTFAGNGTGVFANAGAPVDARSNWWGALSGPSGAGPGTGDAVGTNVWFEPWWSDAARSHRVFDVRAGEAVQPALDAASAGDYVQFQGGTSTGSITLANAMTWFGSNVTIRGDVTITASATCTWGLALAASNLNLAAGTHVVLVNADLTLTGLVIGAGATLTINNGTLRANGVTLTGTFTLDQGWGNVVVAGSVPFNDGFELYTAGSSLNLLGYFGWNASDARVVVQASEAFAGSKAVMAPQSSAFSNSMATAESALWTDVRLKPTLGEAPEDSAGSTDSLRLYFTTNGYVAVSTNGGWDEAAGDAFGMAVPPVSNAWVRLSVRHDFTRRQSAVFLNGRLLRQQVPFLSAGATTYAGVGFVDGNGITRSTTNYIDSVAITTTLPADLDDLTDANANGDTAGDGDGDGMPDAVEVHRFGSTYAYPRFTIFTFR